MMYHDVVSSAEDFEMSDEKKSKFEAFLAFAGEHPILTFLLALVALDAFCCVFKAIICLVRG
jgi:hypothetical protein